MKHSRPARRALTLTDVFPFILGGIILVAVPIIITLSFAASRYASAISPTAAVSVSAASETPTPTPETTPEPEEPVSKYEAVELTEEDTYTLACLVYHEARGEPFEGQVAVVEVVFNRCLSDEFPDAVEEVVFQKYGDVWQFSPAPYLYTAEPSEVQYSAVMYAYNAEERVVPTETVFFSTSPYPYAVKDAAFSALLDLCTDICKRNGKKRLLWFGDKDKTLAYTPKADEMVLTVHRWFANKACPGEYLYSRHGEIAEEVTKRLTAAEKPAEPTAPAGTGDNPSAWAKAATEYCKRKGIFAGDGAGNFDWQKPITREQVAAVLYRTLERAGLLEVLPDKQT